MGIGFFLSKSFVISNFLCIIEILNNVLPNILFITKRILNLSLGIFFAPILFI